MSHRTQQPTRTAVIVKYEQKEYAKLCGAVWNGGKWMTDDPTTFNNSFNYCINNKSIINDDIPDLNDYILLHKFIPWEGSGEMTPTDEEKQKFKFYAFKCEYINHDKKKFYLFLHFIRQDDITTLNKVKFNNFYDLHLINRKHYKYNFNIDGCCHTFDKQESICHNNLFFSKIENAEKYKFFDVICGYKFNDYKKNNISKKQMTNIYNIIKYFNDNDDDFEQRWWTHKKDNFFQRFNGAFFKYLLHLNMNKDPLSEMTNIYPALSNIIYDYL
jgi:hypothetical protein